MRKPMQIFDANLISSPHLYSLARTIRNKIAKPSSCNVICITHSTERSHRRQKGRAAARSVLSPRVQSGHGVFAADMPKKWGGLPTSIWQARGVDVRDAGGLASATSWVRNMPTLSGSPKLRPRATGSHVEMLWNEGMREWENERRCCMVFVCVQSYVHVWLQLAAVHDGVGCWHRHAGEGGDM